MVEYQPKAGEDRRVGWMKFQGAYEVHITDKGVPAMPFGWLSSVCCHP